MQKKKPITSDVVKQAYATLLKYKDGKQSLERRIIENEEWFKMRFGPGRSENAAIKQSSAWLFNSIVNKHADAMDHFPAPNVLPREQGDEEDAKLLSAVLPVVLEQNEFEQTYSDVWWYKLKTGTGCYGVFWNNRRNRGLGDIDICKIDLLNLFWEPGIKNLEHSKNVFYATAMNKDTLIEQYPHLEKTIRKVGSEIENYIPENGFVCTDKALVIDWYYKKYCGGREVVHYCKFIGDQIIFASENEQAYQTTGIYNHGQYPFVFDTMFISENSPAGFGYIDAMKGCQTAIDRLDEIILKNSLISESPRFFISDAAGINEEEYADWTNPFVHVSGRVDDQTVKCVETQNISTNALKFLQFKVDELKETSGNRDFSQGSTGAGVTAASAIQALQEAGNKPARDNIKSSYRAYAKICRLVIALILQFYTENRTFRIVGKDMKNEYIQYSAPKFDRQKMPIFDVTVVPQKQSSYQKAEQNDLAKQLFEIGFLAEDRRKEAELALEMMDFYGKEKLLQNIRQTHAEKSDQAT